MGRPISHPLSNSRRRVSASRPQDREGRREPVERTTVASILSLESAYFLPLLSLCNQASAVDHAQPLRPRCQAIKYTSSYHYLTHTWGLHIKTLLDLRSGASPFDLCSGALPFDLYLGAPPFDLCSGAPPFDLRSGAPPLGLHDSSKFVQVL
jgi:hypothetical protein